MQNECVLLHGWGMSQGVWQLIKPELEFLYSGKVRSLDLPGYGAHDVLRFVQFVKFSSVQRLRLVWRIGR